jgi:hypothetical protein
MSRLSDRGRDAIGAGFEAALQLIGFCDVVVFEIDARWVKGR